MSLRPRSQSPDSGIEVGDWLSARGLGRLHSRLATAERSNRRRPLIASVTEEVGGDCDPTALVLASRTQHDRWSCLEQPDRGGASVATLGVALSIEAAGPGRFERLSARWRELASDALADDPGVAPGSGLIATCAFAFADAGASSPLWTGFANASLVVPEISFARRDGAGWLTVSVVLGDTETASAAIERVGIRLRSLRRAALPLLDPAPVGRYRLHSPMPPAHYEEAVARATERIRQGELDKVVLAREVQVQAPSDHDPAAVLGVLRDGFASSFIYAVGNGDAAFVGATPELLIRREGQRASTVALAGSTRRSADPAVDDHLGEALLRSDKNRHENLIVAQRIAASLRRYSVWVSVAPEPGLVKVANIQHLGAPIRAQLRSDVSTIELAGALHPTPAVGGEPDAVAQRLIPALEGLDRGLYAGTVGWADASGDGEFCVSLRCALLRGRVASCFAGAGIVADSDPASELAETEVKLGALLPVLSG